MIEVLSFWRSTFVVVRLMNLPQVFHHLVNSRIGSSNSSGSQGCQKFSHRQQLSRLVTEHFEQNILDVLLIDLTLTRIDGRRIAIKLQVAQHVMMTTKGDDDDSLAVIPVFDET